MSQLMLINPRKRTGGRKKPRSAAQKAATRRMVAARGGKNPARTVKRRKRRSNPVSANPIGLHRVKHRAKRHHTRARRRNPLRMPAGAGGIMGMMTTSLQGAGGALFVNTALNYIPLPAALTSGNGKYLARVGLALAVGVFGGKVLPHKVATNAAIGAMTVALHDLLLGLAAQAMPTMKLGDVGDYDDGVAAYVAQPMAGLADMGAMYDPYDTAGNVGAYVYN